MSANIAHICLEKRYLSSTAKVLPYKIFREIMRFLYTHFRFPPPPQDYDAFDVANEDDELEEFLGIPRVTPKSAPMFKKPEEGEATQVNGHG